MTAREPIAIVGAGLAGALLAVLLRQRGFPVDIFERRPDLRRADIPGGRSINLALAERGRHALRMAGVLDAVMAEAVMMKGRMVHDRDGTQNLQPYGVREGEVIWSVHRGRLNRTLLDAAEAAGARLRFDARLESADLDTGVLHFVDERDGRPFAFPAQRIVGSDGAGSALRAAMANAADKPRISHNPPAADVCEQCGMGERFAPLGHGYKEIHVQPAADGGWRMQPHALHIWPRGGYMMIALPNADRSFTATLFLPNEGGDADMPSFDRLDDDTAVRALFERDFADLIAHAPDYPAQFSDNPTGLLGTLYLDRWYHGDRAVLLGDAAHAIVPFHGQGMNCAFEDCAALVEALDAAGEQVDWGALFARFQGERKPNADAIAEMALENYVEMRDAVADPRYLLRRAVEQELARRHPERFQPRYSMVMFSRMPYAEAKAQGARQLALLERAIEGCRNIGDVDLAALERWLDL